jgi:hypothetical protein
MHMMYKGGLFLPEEKMVSLSSILGSIYGFQKT